jgi:hypothetical protein
MMLIGWLGYPAGRGSSEMTVITRIYPSGCTDALFSAVLALCVHSSRKHCRVVIRTESQRLRDLFFSPSALGADETTHQAVSLLKLEQNSTMGLSTENSQAFCRESFTLDQR